MSHETIANLYGPETVWVFASQLRQTCNLSEDSARYSTVHNKPLSSLFVPPAFPCNGSAKPQIEPHPSLDLGTQTPWQHMSTSIFMLRASANWASHAPKMPRSYSIWWSSNSTGPVLAFKEVLPRTKMLSINNASATANVLVNSELIKFQAKTPMFHSVFVVMRGHDVLCTGLNHSVGFCCARVSCQWVNQSVLQICSLPCDSGIQSTLSNNLVKSLTWTPFPETCMICCY